MKLRISPDLALPLDAVTNTFGVLAVRGAGKSNLAAVMAEEMAAAKLPFVVVDPTGSWWGVRSSGNGKGPGLSVPIFGGAHGDVPLERTAGQVIADLVVRERPSCVIDVSDFSEGDKIRFLIDFAERLYRKNQDPLHLFLEEADDYAPQRPFREQARLLRAWENIVRRGRARGLGITMISQRSASLNKSVLTQIETLFVLRTTSPQDRRAIGAWVEYHGQAKELLESLPSLEAGEAWVWSPSWLRTMKRVQVRRRWTFDSAATPKDVRGARPPATLADVDLGAVKAQMAATIERAKAEDPRELKRRIAELERELKANPAAAPAREKRVEVPVLTDAHVKSLIASVEMFARGANAIVETTRERYQKALEQEAAALKKADEIQSAIYAAIRAGQAAPVGPRTALIRSQQAGATPERILARPTAIIVSRGATPKRAGNGDALPADGLSGPEQRILDALAWLEGLGQVAAEQTAVAFLAGYTVGGGAFNNPRGGLRTKGLIKYHGDRLALTEEGRSLARQPAVALTADELQRRTIERLPGPEQKLLAALITAYPRSLTTEELAAATGYTADGGAFNNPKGRLRTLGLIDYPERGRVIAKSVPFLEGRA